MFGTVEEIATGAKTCYLSRSQAWMRKMLKDNPFCGTVATTKAIAMAIQVFSREE